MTPDLPSDETARDRAAGAWLTQTQQDLLAPATLLRERAAMLTEDVQPHGPRGLYADLLTIQAVGQHLEDLINDLIPTLTDPAKLAAGCGSAGAACGMTCARLSIRSLDTAIFGSKMRTKRRPSIDSAPTSNRSVPLAVN